MAQLKEQNKLRETIPFQSLNMYFLNEINDLINKVRN